MYLYMHMYMHMYIYKYVHTHTRASVNTQVNMPKSMHAKIDIPTTSTLSEYRFIYTRAHTDDNYLFAHTSKSAKVYSLTLSKSSARKLPQEPQGDPNCWCTLVLHYRHINPRHEDSIWTMAEGFYSRVHCGICDTREAVLNLH